MTPAARLLSTALLILAVCRTAAAAPDPKDDPRVEWLRDHALRVRSVSPDDRDFSDLQPLKKVLGNAQVVLLGEATHGDGTAFLAKARLIRFLHEEMGFGVLAFESGLFDCRKAWEALQAGGDPVAAARLGVFGIWSGSAQVQPLFRYLGEQVRTPHPLELAGFDNQFTGEASGIYFVSDLRGYLRQIGSAAPDDPAWHFFALQVQSLIDFAYDMEWQPLPSEAEKKQFFSTLGKMAEEAGVAARKRHDGDSAFWVRMLANLEQYARMTFEGQTAEAIATAKRMRDEEMGRNLIWMAGERYRGKKIIVWAATMHAARNLSRIDTGRGRGMAEIQELYRSMAPMGEVAARSLGPRMYTLGFTAYEGQEGTFFQPTPQTLARSTEGSLEDLMHRAGLENAIVDLRNPPSGGGWLHQPLISRPLGFTEMRADWSQVVDGMMFLRVMEPSTRAAR
jgi:erythromycin esterase